MNESRQIQQVGRPLTVLIFGIFNIIFGCMGLVFSSIVIIQLVIAGDKSGAASGYRMFLMIMNAIGGLVYPVFLLIFMQTAKVKDAFEAMRENKE